MYNYEYKICIINNDKKNDNANFFTIVKRFDQNKNVT